MTVPYLLCDRPSAGDWLLGSRTWRPVKERELSGAERASWAALVGAGDGPWTTALEAPPPWRRLIIVDAAADSQFEQLRALGDTLEALTPLACIALTGRKFRGLRDRSWEALRGNIHLCVALAPSADARRLGTGLSMLPAVATVDAVIAATRGRVRPVIKWVNDVLYEGRKIAGVLTATRVQGSTVSTAVLGVGLNLARAPSLTSTVFVPEAGCLHRHAPDITPGALLQSLLRELARRYEGLIRGGPGELLEAYRRHAAVVGRRVQIWEEGSGPPAPPAHEGVVTGIDPDLSLRLDGVAEPVTRGRLAFPGG